MSNTKTVMGQASNQYVVPLDIDEVFSTYLYTGNGSTQTITNGIDLAGEGGLVWQKWRSAQSDHWWIDTERGIQQSISSNNTDAQQNKGANSLTSFNSDGFTVGSYFGTADIASWTFRKAPKFFTCLTYTGTGSAQSISHDLGSAPGMVIVKRTDASDSWRVYHRASNASSPQNYYLNLDETAAASAASSVWNNTAPTDATFTVGTSPSVNGSGSTYVAYLFAHNDGDGEFGPDGDQDIIKCGSYTGGGSSDVDVNLGFEPQFVIVKGADISRGWVIGDIMRGAPVGSNGQRLFANTSDAETTEDTVFTPTPTGFKVKANTGGTVNDSGLEYIYIAIRRGPLAAPKSATEVFDVQTYTGSGTTTRDFNSSTGVIDLAFRMRRDSGGGNSSWICPRLTERVMRPNLTNAEEPTSDADINFDDMSGYYVSNTGDQNFGWNVSGSTQVNWMWKRAPGYFDAVAYTGNGTAGRTVSHNLGVAPEMMWIKSRNNARSWRVYHSSFTNGSVRLDSAASKDTSTNYFSTPTADNIILGSDNDTNRTAYTYIAYLFASLPGISKVGSYTGSNSVAVEVDCGFTSGARFVLIKRTDATGDWYIYDSVRGIVSNADDPYLLLNTTDAEAANTNNIEPLSSGFKLTVQGSNPISINGGNYIFYAIA